MQDDRRGGGGRPGGRPRGDQRGGGRRDFGDRDREFRGGRREFPTQRPYAGGDRPAGGARPYGDRPSGASRPYAGSRPYGDRNQGTGSAPAPRASDRPPSYDDGGMAIRLDPRRLSLLKQLAGEAGLRPGELVTHWIEERLDAERSGTPQRAAASAPSGAALESISRRLDELAQRVDQLSSARPSPATDRPQSAAQSTGEPTSTKKRQRRAAGTSGSARRAAAGRRVPLHEEIASVIAEDGPMSAADIARAIIERGRYSAPRSDRPLDAATVNSRVSNPTYRSRFQRAEGKIGLSEKA